MACQRCQGFTVEERMFDPADDIQWVVMTRCINCGDVREAGAPQARPQKPVGSKAPVRKVVSRQPRHSKAVFLEKVPR